MLYAEVMELFGFKTKREREKEEKERRSYQEDVEYYEKMFKKIIAKKGLFRNGNADGIDSPEALYYADTQKQDVLNYINTLEKEKRSGEYFNDIVDSIGDSFEDDGYYEGSERKKLLDSAKFIKENTFYEVGGDDGVEYWYCKNTNKFYFYDHEMAYTFKESGKTLEQMKAEGKASLLRNKAAIEADKNLGYNRLQ